MEEFRLGKCDFVSDWKLERELLRNGVPMALMNSVTSVGCIFVQGCINGYGIAYTSAFLKFLSLFLVLLNLLFVFRSCVQGMGKPAVPMCSGIVEMAVRIAVIFFGLPAWGFAAAAYAEGTAWAGALLLNLAAYMYMPENINKQLH